MPEIKDDKDVTGLTPKQLEKRRRLIEWYRRHGFTDSLYGTRTIESKMLR